MKDKILIIGLGNPGADYEKTRHNFGRRAVTAFVASRQQSFSRHQTGNSVARFDLDDKQVMAAELQSFMNESGRDVAALMKFYKITATSLVIVYDDLDLPFGTMRLSVNASSGGHRGVQSIIDALGAANFCRLRLGIGPKVGTAERFVLEHWKTIEKRNLPKLIAAACQALELMINEGFQSAANKYN